MRLGSACRFPHSPGLAAAISAHAPQLYTLSISLEGANILFTEWIPFVRGIPPTRSRSRMTDDSAIRSG